MSTVPIHFADLRLGPDSSRTALRPFTPGEPPEAFANGATRAERIIGRALALGGSALEAELAKTVEPLRAKHRDLDQVLLRRFDDVAARNPAAMAASEDQRRLIGAWFVEEFTFESTALFNPSVVRHPDQSGVESGGTRIVLSLRGVGEGHVSSLTFRTGVWHADGSVDVEEASRFAVGPTIVEGMLANRRRTYRLAFDGSQSLSERVIYPFLPVQGRGIEDVRLVEFTDDDGTTTYRGTFTAFSGAEVRQALIHTDDFKAFETRGVEGDLYSGKGMALFPRRIGGRFAMLARQDNENVWLLYSDDLHRWDGGDILLRPEEPWESIQIGNCGSPVEIDEGFLVFTHGVGGVRRYSIGAVLLDRDDPSRVIGRTALPLISPGGERTGYVPNVIYSCGALARGREILLPFAVADSYVRFATLHVDAILGVMSLDGMP